MPCRCHEDFPPPTAEEIEVGKEIRKHHNKIYLSTLALATQINTLLKDYEQGAKRAQVDQYLLALNHYIYGCPEKGVPPVKPQEPLPTLYNKSSD